jgi:aspartate/methionine/tyrosine aminotransferase
MRLLVFCGSRAAIQRFDMDPDWAVIVMQYPLAQRQEIVNQFCATPGAKLAVDKCMLHGWRAPDDTAVLFDPSWPWHAGSAESLQAVARVANPDRWGA